MNKPQHFFSTELTLPRPTQLTSSQVQAGYICLLNDQSLILASGDDAATFLHSQLSNDISHLPTSEARYAAYCTPKGRMLASFFVRQCAIDDGAQTGIFLQCSQSLQPALQKRLQMFVMRSKLTLTDVSDRYALIGMGGTRALAVLTSIFGSVPEQINGQIQTSSGSVVRMHDAFGAARYLCMFTDEQFAQISGLLSSDLIKCDPALWRLAQIEAGIPEVVEQTKEQFVPQMINFELIGGVNFRKGCYPGQEIVARSQYLGKLKRRMAIARVQSDEAAVAMEIFSENDPTQPCGMVVNVETDFNGDALCLVEIKLLDQEPGKVHLGSVDGALLQFLPLPYAYLDVTE